MSEQSAWALSVTRLCGHSYMRPEKAWRPILTIEIDSTCHFELCLGVKGENPNMKQTFSLHDVSLRSRVHFKVWKKSESKKKNKKRCLVGSADETLADLLKKQDKKFIHVRFNCQTTGRGRRGSTSSKGKPQNGAYLSLSLKPPAGFNPLALHPIEIPSDEEYDHGVSPTTIASTVPTTPGFSDDWPHPHRTEEDWEGLRQRVKPYSLDPEDDMVPHEPFIQEPSSYEDVPPPNYSDDNLPIQEKPGQGVLQIISNTNPWSYVAASLLPTTMMSEKIPVPDSEQLELWWERAISKFTLYRNLKFARTQEEFETIHDALRNEWSFSGGALAAICGMSTAVFTLTPDSLFPTSPVSRAAIGMSGLISAVGIFIIFWFWLRFHWADFETFNYRAQDLYGTYFFFCLTSKIPLLCAMTSAICLLTFIINVAYNVWPIGSLVICFSFGLILSLQFLVYGVHWTYIKLALGLRWLFLSCKGVFARKDAQVAPSQC